MTVIASQDRLMRPGEVADLLGVSRSKAYSLIASGRIPSIRITGSVRVPATELQRWIQDNTRTPVGAQ